jgi:transcriptional regulator with XRE-family HTH domain
VSNRTVEDPKVLVADLLARLGLTQQQLGEKGGLRREEINKVISGENKATSDRIRGGLATAFGISRDDLARWFSGELSTDEVHARSKAGGSPKPELVVVPVLQYANLERLLSRRPDYYSTAAIAFARSLGFGAEEEPTEEKWHEILLDAMLTERNAMRGGSKVPAPPPVEEEESFDERMARLQPAKKPKAKKLTAR